MQLISKILPDHLPKSMRNYRDKYEHHLILKMGGEGVEEARAFLKEYLQPMAAHSSNVMPKKRRRPCCIALLWLLPRSVPFCT